MFTIATGSTGVPEASTKAESQMRSPGKLTLSMIVAVTLALSVMAGTWRPNPLHFYEMRVATTLAAFVGAACVALRTRITRVTLAMIQIKLLIQKKIANYTWELSHARLA